MKAHFLLSLACATALLASVSRAAPPSPANASEALVLATDDVYDCAELPRGAPAEWAAATAGGLVVGTRVLTALDGLPDTRVESVRLEGARLFVTTKRGAAQVSLPDLRVSVTGGPSAPRAVLPVQFLGSALLRAEHRGETRACFATDQGLRVSTRDAAGTWSAPQRLGTLLPSLPSSNVAAIARSNDALFIGTFDAGLFRRDVRGALSSVDAKNPNINALQWDEQRQLLWVGTARGLVRCERGVQCARIGDAGGIHALAALGGGLVASGGEGELSIYDGAGTRRLSLVRKHGLPFRAVWALAKGRDNTLYAGTTSGLYYTPLAELLSPKAEKTVWKRISLASGELPDDWVTALATSGDSVHVGTYNAGLASFKHTPEGALERAGLHPSLGYVNPGGLTALGSGELAVATMSGLYLGLATESGTFRKVPALGEDVTGVVRGNDGLAWIATRRGVMARQRL